GALQHDGGVQVGKSGGRRRIGQIVRRHIHGLERGDGTFLCRSNPFLQITHLRRQRGLIADRAGSASQQGRDFRTGLGETENVVNEQKDVLVLLVAEVLGNGQSRQGHAQTSARGFVH